MLVVSRVVVSNSESVLLMTQVFVPEKCSSWSLDISFDLEFFTISQRILGRFFNSRFFPLLCPKLLKREALLWTIVTWPEISMSIVHISSNIEAVSHVLVQPEASVGSVEDKCLVLASLLELSYDGWNSLYQFPASFGGKSH